MLARALCLVLMLAAWPAGAQESARNLERAARVFAAFEHWMAQNNVQQGALSLWHKGQPVAAHGVGVEASAPVEMASLSKAITGVCVAELVREGKLGYADRFAQIIGRGPNVSVAQLLNHTSGLRKDSTQDTMPSWVRNPRQDRAPEVLDWIEARNGPNGRAGRFRYNNENYALLGLIIEKASAQSYHIACQQRALSPAGVRGIRSHAAGGFLPWGGWKMSVDDYAAFQFHWFGAASLLGADPFAWPNSPVEADVFYGHGMFFRRFAQGYNFWHHGGLCFPGVFTSGSFAVSFAGGWNVVAAYDQCPDNRLMLSLDQALATAMFP